MFSEGKKKRYDQYVLRNLKKKVLRAVVTVDYSKCLILEKNKRAGQLHAPATLRRHAYI